MTLTDQRVETDTANEASTNTVSDNLLSLKEIINYNT